MIRQRFIPSEGIHNFRDYGGYPVSGGGRVRRGALLRSGQHRDASERDLGLLEQLDLRMVVDLRGKSERAAHPCRRPAGFSAQIICHPGETTSAPPHEAAARAGMSPQQARERMIAVYRRMAHNPAMMSMFSRYLRGLAECEGASLVHCFAGKDRTGIAVMLLQHVLGVHRDDQYAEYLLTNEAPTLHVLREQTVPRLEERYGPLDPEAVSWLIEVREEYLDTFLNEVETEHGSLDAYLERAILVDEKLRARLRAGLVSG